MELDKVFVSSDHHFEHLRCYSGYEPIRKLIAPTFEEFQNELVKRWNSVVDKESTIFHLGDFVINSRRIEVTKERYMKWLPKLNGNKILIKGNHDEASKEILLEVGFDEVVEGICVLKEDGKIDVIENFSPVANALIVNVNGKKVMLSHLPPNIDQTEYLPDTRYTSELTRLGEVFVEQNCDISIHGHTHSRETYNKNEKCNCVSVERTDFYPLCIKNFVI
jgi:calcineurin-like phosphoesterase family protein